MYFHGQDWEPLSVLRIEALNLFEQLLLTDLKYCREENVDQRIWKMLYHNPLETLKRPLLDESTSAAEAPPIASTLPTAPPMATVKATCLKIIDEGMQQFERLLHSLELCYKFQLDDFIDSNAGGECAAFLRFYIRPN